MLELLFVRIFTCLSLTDILKLVLGFSLVLGLLKTCYVYFASDMALSEQPPCCESWFLWVSCVLSCMLLLTLPAAYVTNTEIQHGTVYSETESIIKMIKSKPLLRACSESV